MSFITSVKAIEILDSRGNPTLEVKVSTNEGIVATASVPSGASTGKFEALEMRDGDESRYRKKGVQNAVKHVNGPIAEILIGKNPYDQEKLDRLMIAQDGTENKSRFGANAILGASLALARAGALTANLSLYRYIGGVHASVLPCPMMNIINGGAHADNSIDFQEFMIRPKGASSFREGLRWGVEIYHTLKDLLKAKGLSTSIGDEGGFAPNFSTAEEALEFIVIAIEKAGFRPKEQISLALDCAASEFYDSESSLYIEKKKKLNDKPYEKRTSEQQVDYLASLCRAFPIDSIEDALDEQDWQGWQYLTKKLGHLQIVGDDLFVTNPKFLKKGIELKAANAILVKVNQIGTLTEALETMRIARIHGYSSIISHRSGETEDSFIADISVAVNSGQIKTGAPCRTDRVVKYNRLLNIEEELGPCALYEDGNCKLTTHSTCAV